MLAKEQKIKNLKIQREYLKKKLMNCGGASYSYVGKIFPENEKFLKNEGYNVDLVGTNLISTQGLPLYHISVRSDITLTEEEIAQAESVVTTTEAMHESIQNGVESMKANAGALKESATDAIVKFLGGTRE